ncbi:MAG: Lrp/AsnC family transcriptional regulator [Alistipes sp.]|nr:Lrp/AsnC family transcriptional regulator [Alistipes sp.]
MNSKVTLDATDRKILRFLVKNARMPYLEIARECGISGAAIHQRIKKLEDSGVILGSRMMVNPKMLGFDVCAFISIRIQDPIMSAAVAEKMKNIPEVVEFHFITGTYNAMLKLYCVDNDHLMRTIFDGILRIQGVSTTQTYISLSEAFQREPHIEYLDKLSHR